MADDCGGIRFFDRTGGRSSLDANWNRRFLTYRCRHCKQSTKTYALLVRCSPAQPDGLVIKLGELPPFWPPVPSRLLSIAGEDQELFRKGRQAESQNLGIAAFAYYRRVVENQKSRLIKEIIKVAERTEASANLIATLAAAAAEPQFSTAIENVKSALPEVLKVNGHNPLTLLHHLLSEGLHAQTDEQCLEIATDIRVLLSDLCDRISTTLKDQREVETALARLLERQRNRESKTESQVGSEDCSLPSQARSGDMDEG